MRNIKIETAKRIAEVHMDYISNPEKITDRTSILSIINEAGLNCNDKRNAYKYRRSTEQMLGIKLPSLHPELATDQDIICPSTLDIPSARKYKSFIVTSCVNNSPLIDEFIDTLKHFSIEKNSQLLVIPLRYKNPNAVTRNEDYNWPSEIYPYTLKKDLHISPSLVISGLRLQATAVNPLSGLQANSGVKSAIYGHPQLAMELVATPKSELPKMMHTTGAVSRPRYSATKIGGKAKFHHSFSALYVKVINDYFYVTQLSWDGKGFYFLDEYWQPKKVTKNHKALALVHKDLHAIQINHSITAATERLKDRVKPQTIVWHDVHDHYAQGKYHDLITRIKIAKNNEHLVEKEIKFLVDYLQKYGSDKENLIVNSNHDDHLSDWLCKFNPDKDPHNAPYYFKLMQVISDSDLSPLQCAISMEHKKLNKPITFLSPNEPHIIGKIDVSQHGHRGANGSRGSAKRLAKTHLKTMIGHGHSPCIEKGCWMVGVHNTDLDYAKGLSSWAICDGLIYKNSKRALIFYIKNKTLADLC